MRKHLLSTAILFSLQATITALAADNPTLPTVRVDAQAPSRLDAKVTVENLPAPNRTLGNLLEQVSGVQNTAFGPNAGAPVIRSLGGSRVQLLQDGQSIMGMNALSGDIAVPFDALFIRNVTVNKSADTVRYGGSAIGGSVDIDTGILSRQMEAKDQEMELVLRKGFNTADAQGFRMNFNNQKNISTNIQMSVQRISDYRIPGNSKADACNSQLFPAAGGVNSALADGCQKEARVQQVYNTASQPYIDQFMTENPDWADGSFSFYTNSPSSVWMGKTYINPANPAYVEGTQRYVQNKINRDVTPDYHRTLGNSYARNSHLAVGSTYFFDRGYIGVSVDSKDSEYGVPGFSMENLSFGSDYSAGRPVGVKLKQDTYALEGRLADPLPWFAAAELRASQVRNTSGEYLGASRANEYDFDTRQAELLLTQQQAGPLTGLFGVSRRDRDVSGGGALRYLPDVRTATEAVFVKQQLDFSHVAFDAGFRHERVDHDVNQGSFKTARNSPNTALRDTAFSLNSYSAGAFVELGPLFAAKLRYSNSERAPEINELYASNAHYSIMTQEEGNQTLAPEQSKSTELSLLFKRGGLAVAATGYEMKYGNFLYQGYSGLQTANRLPLKYWKQTDTTVKGFEVDASQVISLGGMGRLTLGALADLVKNSADNPDSLRAHNDGVYLPNMPTNRYGANLQWDNGGWMARLSGMRYEKQKYLGKNVSEEVPLPGFTLVDLLVSRAIAVDHSAVSSLEVFASATNLLDQEARPHNSPLKYIAPLPGRGFQVGVTVRM